MTLQQLQSKLDTAGYPVAYHDFKKPTTIPFIVYVCDSEDIDGADFSNDVVTRSYRVELYTNKKDLQAERKLEQVLNFTHFYKTETYIESEKLFQIAYEFELKSKL